jgi:hypothetical protein
MFKLFYKYKILKFKVLKIISSCTKAVAHKRKNKWPISANRFYKKVYLIKIVVIINIKLNIYSDIKISDIEISLKNQKK